MPFTKIKEENGISVHFIKLKTPQDSEQFDILLNKMNWSLETAYDRSSPLKLKWEKGKDSTWIYVLFEGADTSGTLGCVASINRIETKGFVSVSYITSIIPRKGYATILLKTIVEHSLKRTEIHHVSLEDATNNGAGPHLYGEKMKCFKVETEGKLYHYSAN